MRLRRIRWGWPVANRTQRGASLVLALGVLSALMGILAIIVSDQRTAFRAARYRLEMDRAELAAQSGLQRALAEFVDQDPNASRQSDAWFALGNKGEDTFEVGDDSFRLEILDASGFLNMNSAPEAQLQRLPLTTEQIDSWLDWRSPERDARPEGAKDEYYNALEQPYNAKLAAFDTVDELLLVKGFTTDVLYEIQEEISTSVPLTQSGTNPILADLLVSDSATTNTTANGQTKFNVNTVSLQQMVQRGIPPQVAAAIIQRRNTQGTFTSLGQVLQVAGVNQQNAPTIVDQLTVTGDQEPSGKINVNTAGEAVLNSIPGMTPEVTDAILTQQATGFGGLSELFQVNGFTLQIAQQAIDLMTTNSRTYLVRVIGQAGAAQYPLEALIRAGGTDGVKVLKIYHPPFNDMRARWYWSDEAAGPTTLGVSTR